MYYSIDTVKSNVILMETATKASP